MKLTCGLNLTLLVLMLVVATKAHTVIQCYTCDDCAKVDKNTPVEQCGGENMPTSTSSSVPSSSSTSPSTEAPTTSTTPTTTPSTTTTPSSTTTPTTTTTEIATPPTIGPISSTTSLPTPPSLEQAVINHLNQSLSKNATVSTPPSIFVTPSEEIGFNTTPDSIEDFPFGNLNQTFNETIPSAVLVRQRRHTQFNGITYQCYKIQKKYGNVFGTKRGCIGIKAEESVCTKLDMENGNQTKKCSQCTTTKCNGSSALGVSIATLLVALLAVIYKV